MNDTFDIALCYCEQYPYTIISVHAYDNMITLLHSNDAVELRSRYFCFMMRDFILKVYQVTTQ